MHSHNLHPKRWSCNEVCVTCSQFVLFRQIRDGARETMPPLLLMLFWSVFVFWVLSRIHAEAANFAPRFLAASRKKYSRVPLLSACGCGGCASTFAACRPRLRSAARTAADSRPAPRLALPIRRFPCAPTIAQNNKQDFGLRPNLDSTH
jgi:hypothetical protein